MKALIERIVEKVISKKLAEVKDNSITFPTAMAPKRRLRLKESGEQFNINRLEDYIFKNISKIKSNMEDYGWELAEIEKMRNYRDLASVLGLDSNLLQDVEIRMFAEYAHDIIKNEIDSDSEDDF